MQSPAVRVKTSADLLNKGEYVFIAARPPEITREKKPIIAPVGFWKTLWWAVFSKKYEIVETKVKVWPAVDSVIIVCPGCAVPFSSGEDHKILAVEPLRIAQDITCPYTRDYSFKVADGKIFTKDAAAVA